MSCGSLTDFFPDASIPDPVTIVEDHSNTSSSESKELQSSFHINESVQQVLSQQSVNKTNNKSTILEEFLETPISKFKSHASTRAVTTARVLTSSECLNIIREKEMKKRAEEEEKQRRKTEREEKKIQTR